MESSAIEYVSPPPQPRGRGALRALQAGAFAVVVAAATYKAFELDRFYVPKELVLHLTAVLAGVLAWRAIRRITWSWIDTALFAYIGLSLASALFAQNGWLGTRALALSASAAAVFWTARMLADEGYARAIVAAVAGAVVLAAVTSLLQAYGVETDFFSINRAPGGTLGNRNSIAHMAAFGLPVVLLVTLGARSVPVYLLGAAGSALLVATLVLTRSRAGWLAVATALAIFLLASALLTVLRRRTLLRLGGILALAGAAVAGAVLLPNSLEWVDENPYLSSIRGVANYREGSGAGRLVQYRQTLKMAARHPLLGVGPGNWSVRYPEHAARRDPSMDPREGGRTANPWPSSDWVAFGAERGFAALLLLLFVFGGIALTTVHRLLRAQDADDALAAAGLLACMAGAVVAGLFDAVLLLAGPALLVFATMGALWVPGRTLNGSALPRAALAAVLVIAAAGIVRSAAQLTAMGMYANTSKVPLLGIAARVDPGNYALRVRLARRASGLPRAQRCAHAAAAHDLYPNAATARALNAPCD